MVDNQKLSLMLVKTSPTSEGPTPFRELDLPSFLLKIEREEATSTSMSYSKKFIVFEETSFVLWRSLGFVKLRARVNCHSLKKYSLFVLAFLDIIPFIPILHKDFASQIGVYNCKALIQCHNRCVFGKTSPSLPLNYLFLR